MVFVGLTEADLYTVTITPIDNNIATIGSPVTFTDLAIMDEITDSIEYTLNENIESGTIFKYLLSVDNGDYVVTDTIEKVFGSLISIFEDDCDDMENWTSNKWNNTTSDYHSAPASITDSPYGNYQDNENNIITLNNTIDLSEVNIAFVQFWAKWEIESGYDYVQFMVKDINQGNWVSLKGKYTRTGTQYQQEGEPLYDGFTTDWIFEEIDISQFAGKQIDIRYRLISDGAVTEQGFYFDDFSIQVVSNTTDIIDNELVNNQVYISDVFPNPANNQLNIKYQLNNQQNVTLKVIDIMGNVVVSQPVYGTSNTAKINIEKLSSGVYFLQISTKSGNSKVVKFVKGR